MLSQSDAPLEALYASQYEVALNEARKGAHEGGVPIGSALFRGETLLGSGRNRRVQQDDPILHAEVDCLQHAGRRTDYAETILYTTLAPCDMCTGAILLFGIPEVVVGEADTFSGHVDYLTQRGVVVRVINDPQAKELLASFIQTNPAVWNEDIGETSH